METKFQTSFIPKRPIVMTGISVSTPRPFNIITFLGGLIFLLTLAIFAGVIGFKMYVSNSIEITKTELAQTKASLQLSLIKDLVTLDARLAISKGILSNHIAPSRFFSFLAATSLKDVRFTDLKYSTDGGDIKVELNGEAKSYTTVASQSDAFNKAGDSISSAVFSNLELTEKGNVKFSVKANVVPTAISYEGSALNISQ